MGPFNQWLHSTPPPANVNRSVEKFESECGSKGQRPCAVQKTSDDALAASAAVEPPVAALSAPMPSAAEATAVTTSVTPMAVAGLAPDRFAAAGFGLLDEAPRNQGIDDLVGGSPLPMPLRPPACQWLRRKQFQDRLRRHPFSNDMCDASAPPAFLALVRVLADVSRHGRIGLIRKTLVTVEPTWLPIEAWSISSRH